VHYARTLVVPYPLAITYDVTYVDSAADPRFWGSLVALVAIAAALVWCVRRSVVGRRALVWLALFLLSVLSLKAFNQDESLVHDRYLYLPSIGFALLVALGLEWLAERFGERRERVFWGATAVLCVLSFGITVFQNETWSDDLAMARQALAHDPNRPFLYNYVGAYYFNQNKPADAEGWYKKALDLRPDFYDALSNLGDVCKIQNRNAEAEQYYVKAAEAGAPYYNTYFNLASVYIAAGRLDPALPNLERAIQIDPSNAEAPYTLGWVYDQKNDAAHAEQCYLEALRIKPSYPEPRINLAVLQTKQGRYKEAIDNLQYAQKIVPQHPIMLYALGDVYMRSGRTQDAVNVFTQLAQSQPQHRLVHTSLGLCYETLGDTAKARASFQQAIQVAPQDPYTNTAREHLAKLDS
jgi:tetratricopeptide (TPR) repeat protein